ncbi:hypothetical protein ACIO7M_12520 [Streptomyces toxytricini]|uniref:Uncharacterized protein n=1 Tax=Streptomyces toxytricini TaxID=67369 RepID=A0ABW8EFA6_STRT5
MAAPSAEDGHVRRRALRLTGQWLAHGGEAAQRMRASRSLHRWLTEVSRLPFGGARHLVVHALAPDELRLPRALPGEVVVFHSARTLHGRTEPNEGERVTLLSIGYRVAVPSDQEEGALP